MLFAFGVSFAPKLRERERVLDAQPHFLSTHTQNTRTRTCARDYTHTQNKDR